MIIKAKNIYKYYGDKDSKVKVLNSLDIEIEESQIAVILGPSGCGKSTLLNIIGGIDSFDSGELFVCDQNLKNLSQKELIKYRRENLGYVFQFYNLIPDLTARENIEVCARLTKDSMDIDKLIKLLGLNSHKDKFPRQLSGGQQQRTAIGRALIKKPKLLLCDELTGALDYKSSKEILELIQKVNEELKTTILIVTHNEVIGKMADVVFKMRDGEIINKTKNEVKVPAKDLEW